MSDNERYTISEEGCKEAVMILIKENFLVEKDVEGPDYECLLNMKRACGAYIEASKAKGDKRTTLECRNAILLALFEAYLDSALGSMVN